MAIFQAGQIESPFPSMNDLLAPRELAIRQGLAADAHQNSLLNQEQTRQQMGANQIEYVARASAAIDGVPEADQPALYQQLGQRLVDAGVIPTLPPYPGPARIKQLASLGTPSATLGERAGNLSGNAALLGGVGPGASAAPAGGGVPSGGGKPFVYANLPAGISSAEDQIVRTVIGEAGGEPLAGQQAVAHVVQNRVKRGGGSAQDVIFAPNQFEPWNNPATRAKLEAIDPNSPQYQTVLNQAVRPVLAGQAQDPTGGATHFYSPTAQAQLGREAPAWAQGNRTTIGRHEFYYPGYSGQQQASGGGVAARTGGVDVAGPGGAPAGASEAPATGSYTPSQVARLKALAADGKTTRAQMVQVMGQFDDDNRAAGQQALARQDKAKADARAEAELKLKQDEASNPRQGKELSAQYENDLLRLGPKIEDGTATEAEKRQYSLSHAGYQISGPPVAIADPTDPTGRRQILSRLPREVPAGIPAPPYPVGGNTGAAKPIDPTEGQAKASRYAGRMAVATPVMEKLDDVTTYAQRGLEKAGKYVGYNVNSADYQRLRVAQEAFLSGIIRQDSGAAVAPSEWERYAHLYFPMPGDDVQTVKMKARIRQNEMDNMVREAGPGHVAPNVNLLEDDPKYKTDTPSAPKVIRYDHEGKRIEQ